jgi:transcriptional regulator with XRE-family HTH domain
MTWPPMRIAMSSSIALRRSPKPGALANVLGVCWQQVHKYERGINRVGTSRLAAIADALGVPITYFIDDVRAPAPSQRIPSDLMERPETLQLMRLYYAIRDETVRRQVLAIVEAVAEASAPLTEMLERNDECRAVQEPPPNAIATRAAQAPSAKAE